MSQALACVREAAKRNRNERFTSLMHHVTPELLAWAFHQLKARAAPGVDGVTPEQQAFAENLVAVNSKAHQGSINHVCPAAQAHQKAGAFAKVGVERPDFQPGEQAGDRNLVTGPSPPDLSDHSPMGKRRPTCQSLPLNKGSDLTVAAFYGVQRYLDSPYYLIPNDKVGQGGLCRHSRCDARQKYPTSRPSP